MNERQPKRPSHLPDLAAICLQTLVEQDLAHALSIGGALGLLHYLDYRSTNDVEAWWAPDTDAATHSAVIRLLEAALQPFGEVRTRAWGDVVSIELKEEGRKVFSVQIAHRATQLEPSQTAAWVAVPLDSLSDLLASKMAALVERGAPRDFRDIYAVCEADLVTPTEIWALWRQRQLAVGGDLDNCRAQLAISTHLARITQHRPLDQIADVEARVAAARVREWFRTAFLPAGGEYDA